jgi:hypothetical protein
VPWLIAETRQGGEKGPERQTILVWHRTVIAVTGLLLALSFGARLALDAGFLNPQWEPIALRARAQDRTERTDWHDIVCWPKRDSSPRASRRPRQRGLTPANRLCLGSRSTTDKSYAVELHCRIHRPRRSSNSSSLTPPPLTRCQPEASRIVRSGIAGKARWK